MRRSEARQGVRMMKFLDLLGRYEAAEFSQLEAAELLGVGERTFRRWRQRYDAVKAEQEGNAFAAIAGVDLGEFLCTQEERQVGNDNCVSFNRLKLQIPASPLRPHFVKARVKVRQCHDGTHAVFHGPRCLGRYDRKGVPVDLQKAA